MTRGSSFSDDLGELTGNSKLASFKVADTSFPSTVNTGLSPLTARLSRRMRVSRTRHRLREGTRHAEIAILVGPGRLSHGSILQPA